MSDAKEDEILKRIGDIQKDVTDLKTKAAPANAATKTDVTAIINQIKKGPDDQKNFLEAFFETSGLKDVFEAFKQESFWVTATLAVGALGSVITGKLLDLGKLFNLGLEKLTKFIAQRFFGRTTSQGRVLATGENGLPRPMSRQQADSLTSVSINPHGLTDVALNGLKTALEGLTPKIGPFNTATRQLMSAQALKKLARAIGTLKDKLDPSPEATIKDVATAIETLHTKLAPFDHDKLPKPRALKDIASAARDVVRDGDRLRTLFRDLATASTSAANAIAGP
ncbi:MULTISPECIES: hypothetical protein [unclassified Streptomyces]|uniref:hypothetical protein n=1 Tax=unclassified Streptomyces TaxID=2593676 RepID=UPI002E287467|nr:hypothetical protein [Streptomyces sp. NBC_00228]